MGYTALRRPRRRACGNHAGEAERCYGIGLKLFGFIPEPVFTFIPESCSGSSRERRSESSRNRSSCPGFPIVASVVAQTKTDAGIEPQLLGADHQWQEATTNDAIQVLERIMAPNFVYVNVTGDVISREQWLEMAGKVKPETIAHGNVPLPPPNGNRQLFECSEIT
jgi:hypothetical protein